MQRLAGTHGHKGNAAQWENRMTQTKTLKQKPTKETETPQPNGARYFRCALQVNPFAYLGRYGKATPFSREEEYNDAIIAACVETGIEVIGVTDHYRIQDSFGLVNAARDAGIKAFCGFEAVTKEGVHYLCLFDPKNDDNVQGYIAQCGIDVGTSEESPLGEVDSSQFLELVKKWGAVCIATHVAQKNGLLKTLSGKARAKVWTHPDLLACAISGSVAEMPEGGGIRSILENEESVHKRERKIAILNASDVNGPDDLRENKASCLIKMSEVSVEAFRQAFLDPDSRVRLLSDPQLDPHAELLSMSWEGGFLGGASVRFNESLNVLVGGRGAGKSTMIESIRYALRLDPIGDESRKAHEGVVRNVLQPGTRISLRVRTPNPLPRTYLIERSVPNLPVVKDENGDVLNLSPDDVMPSVEIYGQHEISEIARSPVKIARLLDRFAKRDPALAERKSNIRQDLERSRKRILNVRYEMKRLDERLFALPGLQENLRRYEQAGLERILKEKSSLVREEGLFRILGERFGQIREIKDSLAEELPIDSAFVMEKTLQGLPNEDLFSEVRKVLGSLTSEIEAVEKQFGSVLKKSEDEIAQIEFKWSGRKEKIEENYEKKLRELQKDNIDGEEFIELRRQIEEMQPLKQKLNELKRSLLTETAQRAKLVAEWEEIKAAEHRDLAAAAKTVSSKLSGRVRASVVMAGDLDPLEQLLREIGGNLSGAIAALYNRNDLSLSELAQCCREGQESLMIRFRFTAGAAERIAKADEDLFMRLEELELPAAAEIELNSAHDGDVETWQKLQHLSSGQKATAVLLLLLLESEAPLVVDQPEDDLDNRFISEGVVPIMRQEKHNRQFVFTTHNANIPVLGDAELILGLTAAGEASGDGQARIAPEHVGSIDFGPVRELVEEILEGGKAAFETRRSKYGF